MWYKHPRWIVGRDTMPLIQTTDTKVHEIIHQYANEFVIVTTATKEHGFSYQDTELWIFQVVSR